MMSDRCCCSGGDEACMAAASGDEGAGVGLRMRKTRAAWRPAVPSFDRRTMQCESSPAHIAAFGDALMPFGLYDDICVGADHCVPHASHAVPRAVPWVMVFSYEAQVAVRRLFRQHQRDAKHHIASMRGSSKACRACCRASCRAYLASDILDALQPSRWTAELQNCRTAGRTPAKSLKLFSDRPLSHDSFQRPPCCAASNVTSAGPAACAHVCACVGVACVCDGCVLARAPPAQCCCWSASPHDSHTQLPHPLS